jgi:copper chaperone CopZ
MKKLLFIIISFSLLLLSCSENSNNEANTVKKISVANQKITFEVEGMVCKMGCGGSIRKALLETKSVSQVDVDYQDDRTKQIVSVFYNKGQINKSAIVKLLETINDKQFKIAVLDEQAIAAKTPSKGK